MVGGSNSITKDRYILHFANKLTEEYGEVEILNCSVGATTSITSLALVDLVTVRPDLIVFEFSLNDSGHLNHRPNAYEKKWQMMEMVFDFMGRKFVGVPVLPLILASSDFFDMRVPNSVYDAERDFYRFHGMICHDMRFELFEMFRGSLPEFIYSDKAHFHRGFASSLIGRTLAQAAQRVLSSQKKTNVYSCYANRTTRLTHAHEIAVRNEISVGRVANRHLQLDTVEVRSRSSIIIDAPAWPVCLYIASDGNHGNLSLDVDGLRLDVATIHQDCQEGRFVFTSIPLLLNERFMALRRDGPLQMKLSMQDGGDAWAFDCMEKGPDTGGARRVQLAAIATLETSSYLPL